MLVNSAADWGHSDPLLTARPAGRCWRPDSPSDDVDRVLWRNPVEFYGQSGRLDLDPVPGLRRQLPRRGRREGNSVLPAGGSVHLSYCTNVHPAEDLAGILAQLDTYAVPVAGRPARTVLGLGLWLAAPVAAGLAATSPAGSGCAASSTRAGWRWSPSTGSRTRRSRRRWSSMPSTSRTGPTRAALAYTLDWPGCWPTCCPTAPPAASPRCRWPGATRGPPTRGRRPRPSPRGARAARVRGATGRTVRVAFEPEPGCVIENTVPRRMADARIAVGDDAIDPSARRLPRPATSPAPGRTRSTPCGGSARRACRRQGPGLGGAGRAPPTRAPRRARPSTSSRASCTRPAPRPDGSVVATDDLDEALGRLAARRPWRVHFHVPLHPRRAAADHRDHRRAAAALAAVRERRRRHHLDVETYTWTVLPEPAPTSRRHRRRAPLGVRAPVLRRAGPRSRDTCPSNRPRGGRDDRRPCCSTSSG